MTISLPTLKGGGSRVVLLNGKGPVPYGGPAGFMLGWGVSRKVRR